jgi:hypothetical protein
MRDTRNLQMIYHKSILTTGQTEQDKKIFLEGLIPTPHIILEYNYGAIFNLKPSMTRKLTSTLPEILP